MFRISTEIDSASKIVGEEKAIELLAKAGFEAWDFSMFTMCGYDWVQKKAVPSTHPLAGSGYLKFARRLRNIGENYGIVCNQSHAPFPTCSPEIRSYFKRAIECSAEAGAEICIIHPDNDLSPQENAEIYNELLPFAKEHGVKIASENMWNWDSKLNHATSAACSDEKSFLAHLDAVNNDSFVACLDIGHAAMRGLNTDPVSMIMALGPKLAALHIHDNDMWHDSHAIPFSMNINFNEVVSALKKIDYKGDFTLEAITYLKDYTSDNILDGMKDLYDSAVKIRNMFNSDI